MEINNEVSDCKRLVDIIQWQFESSMISQANKSLIVLFVRHLKEHNLTSQFEIDYYKTLLNWAMILRKDFNDITKKDITKATKTIRSHGHTPETMRTYRTHLKQLLAFMCPQISTCKICRQTSPQLGFHGELGSQGNHSRPITQLY